MRRSFVMCLGAALASAGCYDFDKVHQPCFDDPPGADCESDGPGVGGDGGGGTSGSGGGVGETGGASTGASGSGGSPSGGGSGGTSAGGAGGTGGAATGGSGGVATLAERVQRLKLNEACPGRRAIELYNVGPDAIELDGLWLSATNGAYAYGSEADLSGTLASMAFMVVADDAGDCLGGALCIVDASFGASTFDYGTVNVYVRDSGTSFLLGGYQDEGSSPAVGQCWQSTPDGGSGRKSGTQSLGSPN